MKALFNRYIFFMLVSAVACQKTAEPEEQNSQVASNTFRLSSSQMEDNGLQLLNVTEMALNEEVSCSGNIDVPPQNRALITAIMGGYVKESPFIIGDQVSKGQVLLTLENPAFVEMQEDFLKAKVEVGYLQKDYERQKQLQENNINSTKDFQKVESELKQAAIKLKGLEEKLALIGINPDQLEENNISAQVMMRSPINGTIAMVNISKGTYVNPTEALMEIVDTDHLHLELEVFEKDVLKLKKGQEIQFRLSELDPNYRRGEVHLIGNMIDPDNRTVKVHGHLNEEDSLNLAVGMFVEAKVIVSSVTHQAIPRTAVYNLGGEDFIFLHQNSEGDEHAFDRWPIEVLAEKEEMVIFKNPNGKAIASKVLSGAYHFVGMESEE